MSENTKLWDILGRTDPKHTKSFTRGGGFKGTAIKPMFSYLRLTEQFGPCGTGWGVNEPSFQVVSGDNREVLVYCTVAGWYMLENERRMVFGVGGDKVVSYIKANEQYNRPERWENDDEAFKKAFTDALTNAFKLVGVGADVHMGMFDDSKYVNSMREEFAEEPAKPQSPRPGDGRSAYVKEHKAGEAKRDEDNQKRQVGWSKDGTTRTAHSLKKEKVWEEFQMELLECETPLMVTKLALAWSKKVEDDSWPESWKTVLREEMQKRMDLLKSKPAPDDDDSFPGDRPSRFVSTLEAG